MVMLSGAHLNLLIYGAHCCLGFLLGETKSDGLLIFFHIITVLGLLIFISASNPVAGDEGIEIAASHINLAPELAESNPAFITVLLELTATDIQLFAHLLAGQVLVRVPAVGT